jgi:hypothetical protein
MSPEPLILGNLIISQTAPQLGQVRIELSTNFNDILQTLIVQLLPFPLCILSSCRDNISNLPPIHFKLLEFLKVIYQIANVHHIIFERVETIEEVQPDALALERPKTRVVQGELDSGHECFVKGADAIAGQNENAFVVFEDPKEDGD